MLQVRVGYGVVRSGQRHCVRYYCKYIDVEHPWMKFSKFFILQEVTGSLPKSKHSYGFQHGFSKHSGGGRSTGRCWLRIVCCGKQVRPLLRALCSVLLTQNL